jgi:hypothetical protein
MTRRHLFTTGGLASLAMVAKGQTQGSVYDPQIAAMTIEGRVPLAAILSDAPNVLALPAEVVGALNAGALEIRGRAEYNRGARVLRVYQMLLPTGSPYPLPESPDVNAPFVGSAFDLSIEMTQWYDFRSSHTGTVRRTVTMVGRRLGLYKGTAPLEDEPAVVQLAFDRDDTTKIRMFTLAFAGAVVTAATTPVGRVELEPGRQPQ